MKKIQISAVVLALVFAVASAFTKPCTLYQFTKISGADRSTNRADFQYLPDGYCDQTTGVTCLALWNEPSAPVQYQNPAGTFLQVSTDGKYHED